MYVQAAGGKLLTKLAQAENCWRSDPARCWKRS